MLHELYAVWRKRPRTISNHMFEAETKTTEAIVRTGYAAGARRTMTLQFIKLLMICSLIAASYGRVNAAELSNDPLPTVQENVATHKAVLVDVREPGEWKEGHVEGAISLPLSSLKKGVDTSALERQLPKDKIVYTHCVMGVRALKAAQILEKLGYNVRPLKAGYEDLVNTGFEKTTN
jgi:phage shock protein E